MQGEQNRSPASAFVAGPARGRRAAARTVGVAIPVPLAILRHSRKQTSHPSGSCQETRCAHDPTPALPRHREEGGVRRTDSPGSPPPPDCAGPPDAGACLLSWTVQAGNWLWPWCYSYSRRRKSQCRCRASAAWRAARPLTADSEGVGPRRASPSLSFYGPLLRNRHRSFTDCLSCYLRSSCCLSFCRVLYLGGWTMSLCIGTATVC